jgi:hypothetical protein
LEKGAKTFLDIYTFLGILKTFLDIIKIFLDIFRNLKDIFRHRADSNLCLNIFRHYIFLYGYKLEKRRENKISVDDFRI